MMMIIDEENALFPKTCISKDKLSSTKKVHKNLGEQLPRLPGFSGSVKLNKWKYFRMFNYINLGRFQQ